MCLCTYLIILFYLIYHTIYLHIYYFIPISPCQYINLNHTYLLVQTELYLHVFTGTLAILTISLTCLPDFSYLSNMYLQYLSCTYPTWAVLVLPEPVWLLRPRTPPSVQSGTHWAWFSPPLQTASPCEAVTTQTSAPPVMSPVNKDIIVCRNTRWFMFGVQPFSLFTLVFFLI